MLWQYSEAGTMTLVAFEAPIVSDVLERWPWFLGFKFPIMEA